MTGVNYLGVRLGGAVQVFLTAIKIMSVVIVIGVAFFAPAGRAARSRSVLARRAQRRTVLARFSPLSLPPCGPMTAGKI